MLIEVVLKSMSVLIISLLLPSRNAPGIRRNRPPHTNRDIGDHRDKESDDSNVHLDAPTNNYKDVLLQLTPKIIGRSPQIPPLTYRQQQESYGMLPYKKNRKSNERRVQEAHHFNLLEITIKLQLVNESRRKANSVSAIINKAIPPQNPLPSSPPLPIHRSFISRGGIHIRRGLKMSRCTKKR